MHRYPIYILKDFEEKNNLAFQLISLIDTDAMQR